MSAPQSGDVDAGSGVRGRHDGDDRREDDKRHASSRRGTGDDRREDDKRHASSRRGTGDDRDADIRRDARGALVAGDRGDGGPDVGDGRQAPKRRSAKARQADLQRRKAETGTRRGDARAGFGKDPPPKGGRNKSGRGRGR